MPPQLSSKDASVLIVGAGVFGLSTAIHLAERGYKNVKVLDKQPFHASQYSYDKGCDGASADTTKILRAAYGAQMEYQTLALDAIERWKRWDEEIRTGKTLPPGFTTKDTLFVNNGNLTITTSEDLPDFEKATIKNMSKAGRNGTQVVLTEPSDVQRAVEKGFEFAVNPFKREKNYGILDIQGGFVYADKACRFVLHKAETMGVHMVLGAHKGTFSNLLFDKDGRVNGVRTADGLPHMAELTIMACGGWTPSLMPQLDNLCETTAGSVCIFQLPPGSPLWDRFAPENFPTWTYDIRAGKSGGLYGFARTPEGIVKIGYRGSKFTNPQTQPDGIARSVPLTRWTKESTRQLPLSAASVIRNFVQDNIPELLGCEMKTRLCWYTDSYDNHFVIDFVPQMEGLMVATGGSGHGFKFLPNLGAQVVDRIEGKDNDVVAFWKWRAKANDEKPYNIIMEGVRSARSLHNQDLTADDRFMMQQIRL